MNSLEQVLRTPSMVVLGWALVHFLWQGMLVAIIVAALLHATRRATAQTRYALAGGGMMVMLACPVLTFIALSQHAGSLEINSGAYVQVLQPASASGGDAEPVFSAQLPLLDRLIRVPQSITSNRLLPSIVIIWGAGVGFLALRLLGSWLRVLHVRQSATHVGNAVIRARLKDLSRRMGIRSPVELLESALATGPAVIGVLRPAILFPTAALTGLWPIQVEAILAHELAHIRRHDYLINLLQCVVETLLFYHPAVWWVSGRIRQEREHCCDDLAVEVCGDRAFYANCLADLDELKPASMALAMAAAGGGLLPRIRRILCLPAGENRSASAATGALAVAAMGTAMLFLMADPAVGQKQSMQLTPVINIESVSSGFQSPADRYQAERGQAKAASFDAIVEQPTQVEAGVASQVPEVLARPTVEIQAGASDVLESAMPDSSSSNANSHVPAPQAMRPNLPVNITPGALRVPFPSLSPTSLWGGQWLPRLTPSQVNSPQRDPTPSGAPVAPRLLPTGPSHRPLTTDFPPAPLPMGRPVEIRQIVGDALGVPSSPQHSAGPASVTPTQSNFVRQPVMVNYGGLLFVAAPSGNYVVPPAGQGNVAAASTGRMSTTATSSNYVHPAAQR